ncbi:MAG: hypothetical protein ACFE0I_15475 [Elainellaceae cyanobacterium]
MAEIQISVEGQAAIAPLPDSTAKDSLGWSTRFFERTAGAWQGEPLVRPPQGEYDG